MENPSNLMMNSQKTSALSRVVVFAESGLLGGDLAAWLSGRFAVVRATSLAGAIQAVGTGADALINCEGETLAEGPSQDDLVLGAFHSGCRVIILGMDPEKTPSSWRGRITHLDAIPNPSELMAELEGLPPGEQSAKG